MTRRLRMWLRALFRPGAVERELDEEVRHHLELETERNVRAGMDPRRARRKAMVDFGGEERFKEQAREERRTRPLEDTLADLRYGLRQLRRHPGFTMVALLSLALGIGANTAIFSVVNSVLLRPLPFQEPDRIVVLEEWYGGSGTPNFSPADFLDIRSQMASFDHVAGFRGHAVSYLGTNGPERVQIQSVSPGFFEAFGAEPLLGRFFRYNAEDESQGKMVVLSRGVWLNRFGGDPSVLGRSVSLDGNPHTVVGVAPASFQYPEGTEMWVRSYREGIPEPPVDVGEDLTSLRNIGYFQIRAHLAPGQSLENAQAELAVLSGRLARIKERKGGDYEIRATPLREAMVGDVRPALLVLLGSVGLVLLIACANVANLLLARASSRRRELAVRTAMGASRPRLFRQLLVESLLLGGLAGVLGLALARWGFGGLLRILPGDIPRLEAITLDGPVLLFTLLASLGTGLLFGVLPSLDASRTDLAGTIKDGGRGMAGNRSGRFRELLVVAEIALSVILLGGAGLTMKSLSKLQGEELGFEPEGVLTARMSLPESRYPKSEDMTLFARDILREVGELPGVRSVGLAMGAPFGSGRATLTYEVEGIAPEDNQELESGFQAVSGAYLTTLGVPLLAGRGFEPSDEEEGEGTGVVLVNQALALRHWESVEEALGKRVRYNTENFQEIVGVVGNFRQMSLDRDPRPEVYTSFLREPWPFLTLVLRAQQDPNALREPVRRTVLEVDPQRPIYQVGTLENAVWESVGRQRFTARLLGLFAALAMGLALVGVYGVMAYVASLRTHEIGIRVALGAPRGDLLWLSLRGGVRVAGAGLLLGVAGSAALNRVMRSILYGVSPWDPKVFLFTTILVTVTVLTASWIPARRAAGLNAAAVLKGE